MADSLPIHTPNPNTKEKPQVIILGLDGFGKLWMDKNIHNLPNIKHLIDTGSSSEKPYYARCQIPSVSAPNWSSTLLGISPALSGIYTNDWNRSWLNPIDDSIMELPPITGKGVEPETIFKTAYKQNRNLTFGYLHSWSWIFNLVDTPCKVYLNAENVDIKVRNAVLETINENRLPDMLFIHLNDIDEAGHHYGWGSKEYYQQTEIVDGFIGDMLDSLKKHNYTNTQLLIIADHGGWWKSHSYENQYSHYIPVIFNGNLFKKGYKIQTPVNNLMIAPTILKLFGLEKNKYMYHPSIDEIFNF